LNKPGVDGYYLETLSGPLNRAVRFFEQNGFRRIGQRHDVGSSFVELRRTLPSAQLSLDLESDVVQPLSRFRMNFGPGAPRRPIHDSDLAFRVECNFRSGSET